VRSALALSLFLQGCGGGAPAAETAAAPATQPPATGTESALATPATAASSYQDLQGNPVEIADYAGKKVFVNYWATWCAPCIKEIPSIARAADTLAAENYVFLLASDESLDTINEFLLDRDFTGNFVKLNSYVGSLGIDVMPTSVLYATTGTPVRTWQGSFEWDSAEMLAELRAQ
jgi:thiol-disulfide isomerase/thioredoxin